MVPGDAGIFIVEGLLGIASNLDIRVVAEGIETEHQADQIERPGCLLGQGYLFSRAVDRTTAAAMLQRDGQYSRGEPRHLQAS
ncbi:EAL domain-containing protein [Rhizobium ruizarguesonis]|nr:EAL domain-containing protein [Rhizobium ruizarguesonis]